MCRGAAAAAAAGEPAGVPTTAAPATPAGVGARGRPRRPKEWRRGGEGGRWAPRLIGAGGPGRLARAAAGGRL